MPLPEQTFGNPWSWYNRHGDLLLAPKLSAAVYLSTGMAEDQATMNCPIFIIIEKLPVPTHC